MLNEEDLEEWAKNNNIKVNKRPQKGFFAFGNYQCKCIRCECKFMGDKRAVECADCAYEILKEDCTKTINDITKACEETKKTSIGPFK